MSWFARLFRRKPKPTITVDTSWRADAETQVQIAALIARQRVYGTRAGQKPPPSRLPPSPAPAPSSRSDDTLTHIAILAALTSHDSSPPASAPCAAPSYSSGGGGDYGGGGASGSWDSGSSSSDSSSSYSSSDSSSSCSSSGD